jgi:hypothetical protein
MTAPVSPPTITALSTPPQTTDIVNFDTRADTHVAEMQTLVPQLTAANLNVYNNAVSSYDSAVLSNGYAVSSQTSASDAAASAAAAGISSGSVPWVSGNPYAQFSVTISQIDFQTYRKYTAGTGSTAIDPASDNTVWVSTNQPKAFVKKTAAYTAKNGERITLDTSSGQIVLKMPPSPSPGWFVDVDDYLGTFNINKAQIDGNGSNVFGSASLMDLTDKGLSGRCEYFDATIGWKFR